MRITHDNYVQLKRLMISEIINDVDSAYQLGTDPLSRVKLRDNYQQLILTLECFEDIAAIHDVKRAWRIFTNSDNVDAEDQIESWLDRANLD